MELGKNSDSISGMRRLKPVMTFLSSYVKLPARWVLYSLKQKRETEEAGEKILAVKRRKGLPVDSSS